MKTCATCRFFKSLASGVYGECRRNPPTITATTDSEWPRVDDDDWCGEWQNKPEDKS